MLLYNCEVMEVNITQFIKKHKEFDELPFLVVFRTIQILREKEVLKDFGDVDRIQP